MYIYCTGKRGGGREGGEGEGGREGGREEELTWRINTGLLDDEVLDKKELNYATK